MTQSTTQNKAPNQQPQDQSLSRQDINQDQLPKQQQQQCNESALDMMQGLHEHEDHDEKI